MQKLFASMPFDLVTLTLPLGLCYKNMMVTLARPFCITVWTFPVCLFKHTTTRLTQNKKEAWLSQRDRATAA